jgi:hypothetical protein
MLSECNRMSAAPNSLVCSYQEEDRQARERFCLPGFAAAFFPGKDRAHYRPIAGAEKNRKLTTQAAKRSNLVTPHEPKIRGSGPVSHQLVSCLVRQQLLTSAPRQC